MAGRDNMREGRAHTSQQQEGYADEELFQAVSRTPAAFESAASPRKRNSQAVQVTAPQAVDLPHPPTGTGNSCARPQSTASICRRDACDHNGNMETRRMKVRRRDDEAGGDRSTQRFGAAIARLMADIDTGAIPIEVLAWKSGGRHH